MTPGCTLCGLACEWLRSSYISEWRLFQDPENITPGQYCFCPEDTPHFEGWHNFGSKNWLKGETRGLLELGELPEAKQRWHNGITPEPYPAALSYGSADCFRNGESNPPDPEQPFTLGYPSICWIRPPAVAARVIRPLPDMTIRGNWQLLALILQLTYDDMPTARILLGDFMGQPNTVTSWDNDAGPYPGMIAGVCDDFSLLAVSGTTNELQWALQILYPTLGAVPYANYSTSPVWREAAALTEERLASVGADPTKPILLFGHSYGGVVATLLAADFRAFRADRRIDLWTIGMPRPASSSINLLLDSVRQIHFANDNDPVPGLPPNPSEFGWIQNLITFSLMVQWSTFRSPRGQRILDEDGGIIEDGTTTASIVNILYVIAQVLALQPIDPGLGHTAEEYRRRLALVV